MAETIAAGSALSASLARRLSSKAHSVAALFEKACHLDLGGRASSARDAYLAVLEADFGHRGALANLGALMVRSGHVGAALAAYRQAVVAHPGDPRARTNLANLLRRYGRAEEARLHYEAALAADAGFPEAHQGLSYLLDGVDEELAAYHRARGFPERALVSSPYRGSDPAPLRVLQLVSARGGNVPTRAILDDGEVRLHTLVVEHGGTIDLPPHDLVFNAIGDADRCLEALDHAEAVLRRSASPVINHPDRIRATTRIGTALALGGIDHVRTPKTALLPRRALERGVPPGWTCPFLLRSPGFHTGQHFVRIDGPGSLRDALATIPGDQLLAIEWLDAQGEDGLHRKYRAMLIGGAVLPLHLAISDHWKVHHYTADMDRHPARRDEEAAFLDDMEGAIGPLAMRALARIGAALGLDYAGVDFGLAGDGTLFVFEANATMVIAKPGPHRIWHYRRAAIDRALDAARALVSRRRAAPFLRIEAVESTTGGGI